MNKQLPARPDLGQLKKQAKDLLNDIRADAPEAVARVEKSELAGLTLTGAQRIVAREYGFPSWAKLKLHLETRETAIAGARLVVAAINGDRSALQALLAERPNLGRHSVSATAVLADIDGLRGWAARNPEFVRAKGGICNTEALGYLCLGRLGGDETARVACADFLLAQGADANAGWRDNDFPQEPNPILYAAVGRNNYPLLAERLLRAGAKPNDGESIYHAAEKNHVACLEALQRGGADFGARDPKWKNTPLYFLLGWSPDTGGGAEARAGIVWLLDHGANPNITSYERAEAPLHLAIQGGWDLALIRHLLDRGADANARRADGKSVLAFAVRAGRSDVAALLKERGAVDDTTPAEQFLGACASASADEARRLFDAHREWRAQLAADVVQLVQQSAKCGAAATIDLLAEFGFSIDEPADHGERPLHFAAWHGQVAAVHRLIALGADLNKKENQFHASPLGWCVHGSLNCRAVTGDYPAVAEALLAAGAERVPPEYGSAEVQAVFARVG